MQTRENFNIFIKKKGQLLTKNSQTAAKADLFLILQVDLMKNISGIPQPFLYTRHVHFLNFTR